MVKDVASGTCYLKQCQTHVQMYEVEDSGLRCVCITDFLPLGEGIDLKTCVEFLPEDSEEQQVTEPETKPKISAVAFVATSKPMEKPAATPPKSEIPPWRNVGVQEPVGESEGQSIPKMVETATFKAALDATSTVTAATDPYQAVEDATPGGCIQRLLQSADRSDQQVSLSPTSRASSPNSPSKSPVREMIPRDEHVAQAIEPEANREDEPPVPSSPTERPVPTEIPSEASDSPKSLEPEGEPALRGANVSPVRCVTSPGWFLEKTVSVSVRSSFNCRTWRLVPWLGLICSPRMASAVQRR